MREYRKRKTVIPSVIPNRYLKAHLALYPNYLVELHNKTYNPALDPFINPLVR